MVMVIMIMVVATKDDDDDKVEQDDLDFSTLPLVGTIPIKSIFFLSRQPSWAPGILGSLILGTRRKAFSVPILTELVEYETLTCFHHHCALLAQIMGSETLEVRTRNGDWRRQLVMQPAVYTDCI